MDAVVLHDAFVPQGGDAAPRPAVSVGAGALWGHVYDAVTTRAGRYVQGGGCTTVGVAGLVQGGGFGSFSKRYGLAAGSLLEAEVVTADGEVQVANRGSHPDLFWALKGGGGGSFGVVTRLTLATHVLPEHFGGAFGALQARSDDAYRQLVGKVVEVYRDRLFNPHWGEQLRFESGRRVRIGMVFQGLSQPEAEEAWQPLQEWVANASNDVSWEEPLTLLAFPAQGMWDAGFLAEHVPHLVARDGRPGAPTGNWFWTANEGEVGQFLHGYRSAWLPASLLQGASCEALADAIVAASREWTLSLHVNKGLAGATADVLAEAADTAMNPDVLGAFALAIVAAEGAPAFAGLAAPDLSAAPPRRRGRPAVHGRAEGRRA